MKAAIIVLSALVAWLFGAFAAACAAQGYIVGLLVCVAIMCAALLLGYRALRMKE